MSSVLRARQCLAALTILATFAGPVLAADPIDIGRSVQALGHKPGQTTLMIKRLSDAQIWISNPERAERRYSPASTSKIPHSLIALERGLATPDTVFRWDGKLRGNRAWNQDHTLASAFRVSAVWVFQSITNTAGTAIMSGGLARFGYGNMRVGASSQVTNYWLDNTLKISAREQIDFLSKLALGLLPLSAETYTAAREFMISDTGEGWAMHSKTGWYFAKGAMDIGWHIGWLDCAEETYVFALNMDMPDTRALSMRTSTTHAVLAHIGAFACDR